MSKCALAYSRLGEVSDIEIHTACIQAVSWDGDLEPLKAIGATVISIKNRMDYSWTQKCVELIEKTRPDLLFVHGFNGPVVAVMLQWKLKRPLRFVCSHHGFYYPPRWTRWAFSPLFNTAMIKLYKFKAEGIVTVSDFSKRCLVGYRIAEHKVQVVHNGLAPYPTPERILSRQGADLGERDFVVGVVSRLDPHKGIEYLIDAIRDARTTFASMRLIVIGDGPCRESLKRQCSRLNIEDRVRFVGHQKDLWPWLKLMDVFVLPSLIENHSIALLEAMRAGLPIVATNVGGNPESVRNEQEGLLVPPRDSQALAEAISRLAKDRGLRQQLGRAALQRFEKEFTEDTMLARLATWFRQFEPRSRA